MGSIGKAGCFEAAVIAGATFLSQEASAQVFAPTNAIIGGRSDGTSFLVGAVGADGGNTNYTDNVWPLAESPDHLIDGVNQKYLNFAELNTGAIITPTAGSGVIRSLRFWTANDAVERDPTTYQLLGTNDTITGAGPFPLTGFTPISAGSLALPAARSTGTALDDTKSQLVTFANTTAYGSYLILFPTVSNEPVANSLQIAEVQA